MTTCFLNEIWGPRKAELLFGERRHSGAKSFSFLKRKAQSGTCADECLDLHVLLRSEGSFSSQKNFARNPRNHKPPNISGVYFRRCAGDSISVIYRFVNSLAFTPARLDFRVFSRSEGSFSSQKKSRKIRVTINPRIFRGFIFVVARGG